MKKCSFLVDYIPINWYNKNVKICRKGAIYGTGTTKENTQIYLA